MTTQPGYRTDTEDATSLTGRLAGALRGYRFETLPGHVVELSKHCLLDWLGVTLAGSREPAAAIVRAEALAQGDSARCSLIGMRAKTSPFWAALVNGTASHALDFDDVVSAMMGHPTVPIVPALLAAAETSERADGKAYITAFVAGLEAECRIGAYMAPSHYARGFHVTSTVGTFGAAAACAHWLGLSLLQWQTAFGLAGTQAAGLKSMFGTMTKPFHAGRAAACGLLAARLAANGFTAHPDVLDTKQGFGPTQSDTLKPQAVLHDLGRTFGITGVLFKYHAACYLTHAGIEALLQLKRERDFTPGQVTSVRLRVGPGHLGVCNIPTPKTALEAKFSLRFTAAMAIATGDLGEGAFTDALVRDPRLVALSDKVTVEPVTTLPNSYTSKVEVTLADGSVLRAVGDVSKPAAPSELDRQWRKLAAKFHSLADPIIGEPQAGQIVERVGRLEASGDIREIVALACTPGT
ncbi:MAG: MmgE/PrpD family protein [Sulfurifustaceae bacterium]